MTGSPPPERPRGPRVLVGRPELQAGHLARLLRDAGCDPVCVPLVAIEAAQDAGAGLAAAVDAFVAGSHGVVAFTSSNAVRAFAGALAAHPDAAPPALAAAVLACVGPSTAASLRSVLDVEADVVAPVHTGAGLATTLLDLDTRGPVAPRRDGGETPRVLVPRSDRARDVLPDMLRQAGWDVEAVTAYRTVPVTTLPAGIRAELADGTIELVAATSPSAVHGLVQAVGSVVCPPVVAIGPVTAAAARSAGLRVAAVADPHTAEGLVAAVLAVGQG